MTGSYNKTHPEQRGNHQLKPLKRILDNPAMFHAVEKYFESKEKKLQNLENLIGQTRYTTHSTQQNSKRIL